MAKLYFYYGAVGSSKTANALMTHFNYNEVGQKAILCKPMIDTRFGADKVRSRIGLEEKCIALEDVLEMSDAEIKKYNAVILDEVQFDTKEQIDFLSYIVDSLDVPVVCYGLRADFQNELFEGSKRLLTICDVIKEIKTVCWCGKKALCNARYNEKGIVREGEQVFLGANDCYVALCRKHFKEGNLGPNIKF